MPTQIVDQPRGPSISAIVAAAEVIRLRMFGKPVSKFEIARIPTA